MRILVALTYYRPHISGLTTCAQRLAESLAARGHQVTVLTSRYDAQLPLEERRNGVRVIRVGVAVRFGKGVVMPAYRRHARELVPAHDVLLINYPLTPAECGALLTAAAARDIPVVAAYHCDLDLDHSFLARRIQATLEASGRRLLDQAVRVLVLSRDYANSSPLLRRHLAKVVVQPPPVNLQPATPAAVHEFRSRHAADADVVIGVAARVAAEKGLEYLLAAHEPLVRALGRVRLLITGAPGAALGERRYWARIAPLLAAWHGDAAFTGPLSDEEMAAFFGACDVTCLPSINRTESFGLVQVESLLCGTPVVATDLPGIRDVVARTGMGRLVPPRNSAALAEAIVQLHRERVAAAQPREVIEHALAIRTFPEVCEQALHASVRHTASASVRAVDGWRERSADQARTAGPLLAADDELPRLIRLHVRSVPPFRALVRGVESLLIRHHAPTAVRVLDLGCGDGQFAGVTLPTPVRYGLEPDPDDAARAARSGVYERVLPHAAARIPLPEAACDLVLANSVLEHIPDLEAPLAEVHRVLAEGGWLLMTAPSHRFADGFGVAVLLERAGLHHLADAYRRWFNRRSRHHHLDSAETWRTRLAHAGFVVHHHEYYLAASAMFWFDLLHYVSIPSALARRVIGRWHWTGEPLFTTRWTRVLTRLARRVPETDGAYVLLLARKV